jgi:multidrug efflux pump subunit AcrA (membrane-fusion protein)
VLLQVNDLKADYARQLSAAEARVADIEAARSAAEQQAQALQQQLDSNKALAEQVGSLPARRMMKSSLHC